MKNIVFSILQNYHPTTICKKCYQICQKVAKKCYQIGQKVTKMTKNRQTGKKSPKWLKALKLGSKGFQGVPDGSRSQTAWARTTRGTYARAPYAFAALGCHRLQHNKLSRVSSISLVLANTFSTSRILEKRLDSTTVS